MVQLAHISDIHLAPLPFVGPHELFNKRITGFLNWRIKRQGHMHSETLNNLIEHMIEQNPDFTAVTGDLVNLSLNAEFETAAEWIKQLGPPSKVCTIPGNHDAYLKGSREKFCTAMGDYGRGSSIGENHFPFVRHAQDVAIIACNSAVATPPFFATGAFDDAQAARLRQILLSLGETGMFRVVLIHHPPTSEHAKDWRRGLKGADKFRKVIAEAGAELILHGHLHRSTMSEIPGPKGGVPVVGVASASEDAASGHDPARYNLFTIERKAGSGAWTCHLAEYGYQRIGDDINLRLQMTIL